MAIGRYVRRALEGRPIYRADVQRGLTGLDEFLERQQARVRWTLKRHGMRAAERQHGKDGGGDMDPLTLMVSKK